MIYELRIYEAAPGKLPELNNRFANHTLGFFARYDIKVVGFWTEEVGTSNNLVYILGFENWGDREKKWSAFMADPDWHRVKAESETNGLLVHKVHNKLLRPTDYSPLK